MGFGSLGSAVLVFGPVLFSPTWDAADFSLYEEQASRSSLFQPESLTQECSVLSLEIQIKFKNDFRRVRPRAMSYWKASFMSLVYNASNSMRFEVFPKELVVKLLQIGLSTASYEVLQILDKSLSIVVSFDFPTCICISLRVFYVY